MSTGFEHPKDAEQLVARPRPHLRPAPAVYAQVAQDYAASGLGSPLPFPPGQKEPPPRGYTGRNGKTPTPAKIRGWVTGKPAHNVGLRLAPGLLGIDVDCYNGRVGAATIKRAQAEWGVLPGTVRSSSRRDGVSGIYLYQVPEGLDWPGKLSADLTGTGDPGNVELIHVGLRYVVCWPSEHPEGPRYRWWSPDGQMLQDIPCLHDVPDLPLGWITALCPEPTRLEEDLVARTGDGPAGEPSTSRRPGRPVADLVERVRKAPESTRNNTLNDVAFTLGGNLSLLEADVHSLLVEAAVAAGLDRRSALSTFTSGWTAGRKKPYL